ncbi:SMa0974 family conjugal transfer regulator [Mesorhizobium abyssinicae]|uniref:SMa0974 family conjugal transfer regulator n=1 Tax=Mesorhizobium abyssinicae TaxID=1209958 RepID=UPI0033987F61
MSKYAAEALVTTPDAGRVRERVCARSREYCNHIAVIGTDTLLQIAEGSATLRPTDEGLRFRVEAMSLVTFYAIRTLVQGSLSATDVAFGESVEWRPVEGGSEDDLTSGGEAKFRGDLNL